MYMAGDGGSSSDEDSWCAAKVQMPDGSKKVGHMHTRESQLSTHVFLPSTGQ